MGPQLGQLGALPPKLAEQGRHSEMQLLDLQAIRSVTAARGANAVDTEERSLINSSAARQRELQNVLGTECRNQLPRCS
jgi:hypothetical protein